MERRITRQVRNYQSRMKDDIRGWLQKHESGNPNLGRLLEFIYDYPSLEFSKEDFEKRRRIKNQVPISDRCTAKRANGEQCTRRKKDACEYCGTHAKGTPHDQQFSAFVDPYTHLLSNKYSFQRPYSN